jgi:hypothetical protein
MIFRTKYLRANWKSNQKSQIFKQKKIRIPGNPKRLSTQNLKNLGNPNKKSRNPNKKILEFLVWISGFFVWISNFLDIQYLKC